MERFNLQMHLVFITFKLLQLIPWTYILCKLAMADDEYERTLLQLPEVLVFKIPALKNAGGHRAADWPTTPVWSGKLKIVEKSQIAVIILLDDKNQTFAVCPVNDDGAVDRTVDSGRYFVLRIENAQGKKAFIGIAFNERNDAFDFNVALSEHKAQKVRESKAGDLLDIQTTSKLKDLSLKDGEKVHINISSSTGRRREKATTGTSGGLLAPPPGSKGLQSPKIPSSSANSTQSSSNDLFTSSSSSFPASDPFSSSGSFSDPFASTTSSDPFSFEPSKSVTTSKPTNTSGTANLLDF